MGWKDKLVAFFSPLGLRLLKADLYYLKRGFQGENSRLKTILVDLGFHPALCSHPSILFEEKKNVISQYVFLKLCLGYLKKCIKIGLLKSERSHIILKDLGIQSFFHYDQNSWFDGGYPSLTPYHIPFVPKYEGRTVIYSVLTGQYDDVHEVLYKEDNVDYLLFTNNLSITSKSWQVVYIQSDLDDVILSRDIKMRPYAYLEKYYETSIYLDANAVVYGALSHLASYLYGSNTLAITRHSERSSVKQELLACVEKKRIDKDQADMQYNKYILEGFCDDIPLMECGLIVRKHNDPDLQVLMEEWYREFKGGIHRDQISLTPCISRLHFDDYVVMEGSVWHNQFIRILSHNN